MVRRTALVFGVLTAGVRAARPARAASVIRQPGQHVDYSFEAEPHLSFGLNPPGRAPGGAGLGFRGTVELVDPGFVKTINDTIGIGFGAEVFSFGSSVVWVPVVMQWNFWLTEKWSVFGEPGGGFYLGNASGARPAFYAGGRYQFSDSLALTLRAGFPALSVGVSFFP
ncbi:MAG: hypothetical protein IT376_20070 [Polyangiaceae bacterium]|nr:hypothetical protein [Polyangiaceae bacterium]